MIKYTYILLLVISLLACSNAPTQLVVAPQVNISTSSTLSSHVIDLQVRDLRSATHIVQVIKDDRAASLISSQSPLAQVIEENLSSGYQRQGLVVRPNTRLKMTISIEKALIDVNQMSFEYQAKNTIILKVELASAQGKLTKTFTKKGHSKGPLSADIAVLSRDFNQQLASVLQQVIQNNEIVQYIREKS